MDEGGQGFFHGRGYSAEDFSSARAHSVHHGRDGLLFIQLDFKVQLGKDTEDVNECRKVED